MAIPTIPDRTRCALRQTCLVVVLSVLLAFGLVIVPEPAQALQCENHAVQTTIPDRTRGIRTKWKLIAGQGTRHSFQPNLFGLSVERWMTTLEDAGVNLIELNIDPGEKTIAADLVSDEQINSYIANLEKPASSLSAADLELRQRIENELIPNYQYTNKFRNKVLLSFLERVDELRKSGKIKGTAKFIIHQRLWFRPGDGRRRVAQRDRRVVSFAKDMAALINGAKQRCLDHWISGIRLGENSATDPAMYLSILERLAAQVNEDTGGWLRKRLFLANGPGMGAEFEGILNAASQLGKSSAFFSAMSRQTGSFAFGYKWMLFGKGPRRHISQIMADSTCGGTKQCNSNSVADWSYFLGTTLGFNELNQWISANHDAFPNHANVVFVGDSSDSIGLMVKPSHNKLVPDAELGALYSLWPDAGTPGWSGRVFVNGYGDSQSYPTRQIDQQPDIGTFLFAVGKDGRPVPMKNTMRLWNAWPNPVN